MYGQAAPSYPQQPHGSPGRAGTLALRIVFASFPVWSLGLLTWVPSLRFAILRKRPLDWAVFAGSLGLTVLYVVLLLKVPAEPARGAEGDLQFLAGVYALLFMTGGVVHAVLADRFPRGQEPAPQPQPVPMPTPQAPAHPYGPGYAAPVPGPNPNPNPYAQTIAATPPPAPSAYPSPHPESRPSSHPGPHPDPRPSPHSQAAPPQRSGPPGPPAASPRMRQVASELDDLDELLRGRGPNGQPDPNGQPGQSGQSGQQSQPRQRDPRGDR